MGSADAKVEKYPDDGKIIPNPMLETIMGAYLQSQGSNDLSKFKDYLEDKPELLDKDKISAVKYHYDFKFNLYQAISEGDEKGKNKDYKRVDFIGPLQNYMPENDLIEEVFSAYYASFKMLMSSNNTWNEMVNNDKLIEMQYDCIAGKYPDFSKPQKGKPFPLVLVVDAYNRIPDYTLYMLGALNDEDVKYIFSRLAYKTIYGKSFQEELDKDFPGYGDKISSFDFDDLINKKYTIALRGEFFEKVGEEKIEGVENTLYTYDSLYGIDETTGKNSLEIRDYSYLRYDDESIPKNHRDKIWKVLEGDENGADKIEIEIVGVLRQKENVAGGALDKYVYYTPALTQYLIKRTQELPIIKDQLSNIDINIDGESKTWDVLQGAISNDSALLDNHLRSIGLVDEDDPVGVSIYPTSFENKDYVIELIDNYNATQKDEKDRIKYTDSIGQMMSSITDIINAITYVLIAFVSISLIVSSIMIGVITYISVLERTKEIGILRSIGASKKDVARVFNAETVIVGFIAGALGVIVTVILDIPISIIINSLTGIPNVASLPIVGAIALVLISIALTLIAGIIPSSLASKKDPVIALRSE